MKQQLSDTAVTSFDTPELTKDVKDIVNRIEEFFGREDKDEYRLTVSYDNIYVIILVTKKVGKYRICRTERIVYSTVELFTNPAMYADIVCDNIMGSIMKRQKEIEAEI